VLFDSWGQVARVVAMGAGAYVVLLVVLRASGKRTLAKLNAFDLVVTVALGSTLATIVLSADVAFVEGAFALAVLVAAQFAVAWLSVRLRGVRGLAKGQPSLLLQDGLLLHDALRRQRVTPGEVRQAVRATGVGGLELVAAVVLETDGTLSVIPVQKLGSGDALHDADRASAWSEPTPDTSGSSR
jgi:uncharacterized membrane protein YcaP (DUF421 family)